jgi:hypothetical protein
MYLQRKSTFDGLMIPPTINVFVSQTVNSMEKLIAASGVGEKWTVRSDLFTFVRDLASTAVVNALCGPTLLKQCPAFMEVLRELDANIHWLHIGVPRILRKDAYRAR